MSEWEKYKLSNILEIIGGGTPKTSVSEYWNGEIPWLSVVDFNNGRKFVYDTEKKITKLGLDKSSTKILKKGDIIISARGTVGALAVLGREMAFNQSCYGIRAIKEKVEQNYLYYLLKYSITKLLQISHGGVFDTITKDTFNNIEILIPKIPEQKAISEVLINLDNKIELLHKQNNTLESMAETLFRQWFVEKAESSWDEISIGQELTTILGGTPSTKEEKYWNGNIPWINSGEVNKFRITNGTKFITELGLKKSNTKLLPIGSTVLAITGATLGQISMLEIQTCANQSVIGIIPSDVFPSWFVFLWIKYKITEIVLNETGGAQGHINKNDINATSIIKPPKDLIKKASDIIQPIFSKISNNVQQIQKLTNLRDILLPKLISGEIRLTLD